MGLIGLPQEVLLIIASFLRREAEISSLSRTCYLFRNILNPYLYRYNSQHKNSSALLWAAKHGNVSTAEHSIQGGADTNVSDQDGMTPLRLAARRGHAGEFKLLLETGTVDVNEGGIEAPIFLASKHGHAGVMTALLETEGVDIDPQPSRLDRRPLSYAAEHGHEVVVDLLLKTGKVKVDAVDSPKEKSALCYAAYNGHKGVVKLLLETGKVKVDRKDFFHMTPLALAAYKAHEGVVRLLLDTGKVDVNSKNDLGQKPLWLAKENGHEGIVNLLVELALCRFERVEWNTLDICTPLTTYFIRK